MTQRILDVENAEDMALLWDILPDDVYKIKKEEHNWFNALMYFSNGRNIRPYLKIHWHDKTEIERPIQEATEKDFGKICKGWNGEDDAIILLKGIDADGYFVDDHSWCWKHCRRLTKEEIEELC